MAFAATIILLAFALWAIVRLHECGFRDNKPSGSGQLNYEAYW